MTSISQLQCDVYVLSEDQGTWISSENDHFWQVYNIFNAFYLISLPFWFAFRKPPRVRVFLTLFFSQKN